MVLRPSRSRREPSLVHARGGGLVSELTVTKQRIDRLFPAVQLLWSPQWFRQVAVDMPAQNDGAKDQDRRVQRRPDHIEVLPRNAILGQLLPMAHHDRHRRVEEGYTRLSAVYQQTSEIVDDGPVVGQQGPHPAAQLQHSVGG